MSEQTQGGKWIAPEDVPDPIALRGHSIPRVASTPPPARIELGTMDPLDPPSLEALGVAAETVDFTLEPPTERAGGSGRRGLPPAVRADDVPVRVVAPRRPVPAAVWVGGTLLVVAVLSMGLRMLTAGASVPAPELPIPAPPREVQPEIIPANDPVPVEAAGTSLEAEPARPPSRSRRTGHAPPQAAVRSTSDAAPPTATVRPLNPPASASLDPDAGAVNPWSEVEP